MVELLNDHSSNPAPADQSAETQMSVVLPPIRVWQVKWLLSGFASKEA